jgi:hypothetical protein
MNKVETKELGNSDMSITPVGFGAWALGGTGGPGAWGQQDDRESIALAIEARRAFLHFADFQLRRNSRKSRSPHVTSSRRDDGFY